MSLNINQIHLTNLFESSLQSAFILIHGRPSLHCKFTKILFSYWYLLIMHSLVGPTLFSSGSSSFLMFADFNFEHDFVVGFGVLRSLVYRKPRLSILKASVLNHKYLVISLMAALLCRSIYRLV